MITFVCWKWKPRLGYRSKFDASTVNVLRAMVARHYQQPHRFVCITDDAKGIDPRVEIVPLWPDHAHVPSPHGGMNPSCYRRLKIFARDAGTTFGERVVSLDLDCVITGDIAPLFAGREDFRIWGDTAKGTPYNGGFFMLRTGARPQVWEKFDPATSPRAGQKLGYIGSDQAWIGACLGPRESKWSAADGVYSFRNQIAPPRGNGRLPASARIVFFHGKFDPWMPEIQRRYPWVEEHYRA